MSDDPKPNQTANIHQTARDHATQIGVVEGDVHFHTHTTPTGIPLQRPPRAPHFTDREIELAQLLSDLQPGRVVTLCGPGGIGKTALAAEAVWSLAPENELPERFPDGIIFHSFYNQPQANLALEHIATSFGIEPRPSPAAAALQALAGKRVLLLLDGTEEADDLSAVLAVRGGCGVLVTSRARQDAVAERQDIKPLSADDAVALLCRWGGDRVTAIQVARQICEMVGHLPLAVRLVGRHLAQTDETAAEYLSWLTYTPLDALDQGERCKESIPMLLEKSLARVSENARHILSVVGLLALAPFRREPLAAALDLSPNQLRRPLGELISYGLLIRSAERYEVSHALIHTYARQCCPLTDEGARRLAAYYTQLAKAESAKKLEGYRRLDVERAHLMRVLDNCLNRKDWEAAQSLAQVVGDYLDIRGYWTERVTVLDAGVKAAQELGHRKDEGVFWGSLGNVYRDLGQVKRAITFYEQALSIAREIGDRQGEVNRLGNLGSAHRALGQAEQAITYYEQALSIAREIGDRKDEANRLGNLGLAYNALGQMEQAVAHCEQALAIARQIGNRRIEGNILGDMGLIHRNLGQARQAIAYCEQALDIAREIGHRRGEGSRLGNLGTAYYDLGQTEQAIAYYEQALSIAREIGHRRGEGNHLCNLGVVYRDLGQVEQAITHYEQALTIAREIGNRRMEGTALGGLGAVYCNLGQVERAITYSEQALTIAREIGDRRGKGNHLFNLAVVYNALGQTERAVAHYEQALAIAREIGDRRGEAIGSWNLGLLYENTDPIRAATLMQVHVNYEHEIGHPSAEENAKRVAQIKARIEQDERIHDQ